MKKYAIGGLPQGGIIIGLALSLDEFPAFDTFKDLIISIVIGAVIIQELSTPLMIKRALKKAGEIQ